MTDKKALTLLKKYYLPYTAEGTLSESDRADAFKSGILVPDSAMTHDEIITAIKSLSEDISLESTAKAFLYSLSSGDMRYRTALSSLVWARHFRNTNSYPITQKRRDGARRPVRYAAVHMGW